MRIFAQVCGWLLLLLAVLPLAVSAKLWINARADEAWTEQAIQTPGTITAWNTHRVDETSRTSGTLWVPTYTYKIDGITYEGKRSRGFTAQTGPVGSP